MKYTGTSGENYGGEILKEPTEKQLKTIKQALKYFGSQDFIEYHELLVNENNEVFVLSNELYEFISDNSIKPLKAGLKVGEIGKRFRFGLEGTFFLARKKKKRVYVNKNGEMLFLYGRDLFAESIRKAVSVKKNDIVFICNTEGDIIGIGRSRFDGDEMRSVEKETVVVRNLIDRGEYLRKKKLYSTF
jgi:60S ribosome subunit biogenesis protein NIP7